MCISMDWKIFYCTILVNYKMKVFIEYQTQFLSWAEKNIDRIDADISSDFRTDLQVCILPAHDSNKAAKNVYDQTMINVLQRKLFQWTCERHATNQPLNREILGDKVINLSTELGLGDFKCSKSWLTTFLKKHGFSPSLTTSYGPIFNDYREWIELMRSYMTQYRYKNLFQVDEMGMYHDISPENIPRLSADYVTCRNGENRVNRVTVLLCCNASGDDKLPPVICGNFENQLDAVNHNCQYHTNQNAWLTAEIFKLWLSQLNTKMCKLNRKILLMLNRTRVHTLRDAVLSNVSLMFFPNDFPSDLQPLRSTIFRHVKMIYRRNYTKRILDSNSINWNMTDTITNVVNAWDSVPEKLIVTSFRRTNFRTDNNHTEISCPEWESFNPGISFQRYVTFDDNLSVSLSPIRRSKRLAEIKKMKNYQELGTPQVVSCHRGCYELIELGDSELDEDVMKEVPHCSEMSRFSCNLPVVNSYDCAADGLTSRKHRDVENPQNSKPEDGESDSRLLQCSKDLYCACPLTDTVISYVSDIVKNAIGRAVDNIADFTKLTDGSQRVTSRITNGPLADEDDVAAPIRSKRKLGKIDEDDVPNDDSREPTEKKQKTREEGWSDIYEHRFVFGSPENPPEIRSAHTDQQTAPLQPTINSSERNDDLEKRSIFTISDPSPNGTQNE